MNHYDDDKLLYTAEVLLVTHVIQLNLLKVAIPKFLYKKTS